MPSGQMTKWDFPPTESEQNPVLTAHNTDEQTAETCAHCRQTWTGTAHNTCYLRFHLDNCVAACPFWQTDNQLEIVGRMKVEYMEARYFDDVSTAESSG